MDRAYLLKRAAELGQKNAHGMSDAELESWIAETELSGQFWDKYDREIAELKACPHDATGFDTADLDGQ